MDLHQFRRETRLWLEKNCPAGMRDRILHFEIAHQVYATDEGRLWTERMASQGWNTPLWPKEYGGAALTPERHQVLLEEMSRIKALPGITGLGTILIGPLLLELGSEDQKRRHLAPIARSEVVWCQGYSEPGAGSDLASLQTRAVPERDRFVINGQKIWTSSAMVADWMFALVRTDPLAPKHEGISFLLLDMHQSGVAVKPIRMISGASPFCETFFDDAIAHREDLVGELNQGWSVAKRLLQYERAGVDKGLESANHQSPLLGALETLAWKYVGVSGGKIADASLRDEILRQNMAREALQLTGRRVMDSEEAGIAPGAVTSIFKYVGSLQVQQRSELQSRLMGTCGLGWEGSEFSETELEAARTWLRDRAATIYGGTNEIQLNVISKRILGLPD